MNDKPNFKEPLILKADRFNKDLSELCTKAISDGLPCFIVLNSFKIIINAIEDGAQKELEAAMKVNEEYEKENKDISE